MLEGCSMSKKEAEAQLQKWLASKTQWAEALVQLDYASAIKDVHERAKREHCVPHGGEVLRHAYWF
jgi:hypothetical protein